MAVKINTHVCQSTPTAPAPVTATGGASLNVSCTADACSSSADLIVMVEYNQIADHINIEDRLFKSAQRSQAVNDFVEQSLFLGA